MVVKFSNFSNEDRYIKRLTIEEYQNFLKEYIESKKTYKIFASNREVLENINNKYIFWLIDLRKYNNFY